MNEATRHLLTNALTAALVTAAGILSGVDFADREPEQAATRYGIGQLVSLNHKCMDELIECREVCP